MLLKKKHVRTRRQFERQHPSGHDLAGVRLPGDHDPSPGHGLARGAIHHWTGDRNFRREPHVYVGCLPWRQRQFDGGTVLTLTRARYRGYGSQIRQCELITFESDP